MNDDEGRRRAHRADTREALFQLCAQRVDVAVSLLAGDWQEILQAIERHPEIKTTWEQMLEQLQLVRSKRRTQRGVRSKSLFGTSTAS